MILGDGERTIAKIISDAQLDQANRPPWLHSVVPVIDDDVLSVLYSEGLTPEFVPESGKSIKLRRLESTVWGGVDEEVTDRIHPDNLSIALQATKLLKLSVSGVDIITTKIEEPWYRNGAIISEVNYAPLLGGAAISRSYLPRYLESLIEGNGRIPVESFKSKEALDQRYNELTQTGFSCFTVGISGVLDSKGKPLFMLGSVKQQVRSLLLRNDVDAILVMGAAS